MAAQTSVRYNQIHQVTFRAGWIGFFAGESQTKALDRVLDQVNARGLRVAAMTVDRWSFWKRLLWAFVLVITLGFVGRVPNILVVTEPMDTPDAPPLQPQPEPRHAVEAPAPVPIAPARAELEASPVEVESSVTTTPRNRPAKKTTAKKTTGTKKAPARGTRKS